MKHSKDIEEDKRNATFRRLLLAKQLYLHGLDSSFKAGALNKMIAVHNFHNAIEVVLRAIFLQHEIRAEKQLNIDFESMLNEIDNHQKFKDAERRLPYRQEIRNLNQLRNLVQHHAVEPESSTMDDWRVFTKRFLIRTFSEYFGLNFDELSSVSLINDQRLRALLILASEKVTMSDWATAISLTKIAFEYSSSSIASALPSEGFNSSFFVTTRFRDEDRELARAINSIYQRIREAETLSGVLASGVTLTQLKKFEDSTPHVMFAIDGTPHLQGRAEYTQDECKWSHDFVVNTIINWQLLGLEPSVPEGAIDACNRLISEEEKKGKS